MSRYCWDCAANVKAACGANCLLADEDEAALGAAYGEGRKEERELWAPLVRKAYAALETCGGEDGLKGRAQWYDDALVEDAYGSLAKAIDDLERMANLPEAVRREAMYRESDPLCFVCSGSRESPRDVGHPCPNCTEEESKKSLAEPSDLFQVFDAHGRRFGLPYATEEEARSFCAAHGSAYRYRRYRLEIPA
jgi:hypothetical protein